MPGLVVSVSKDNVSGWATHPRLPNYHVLVHVIRGSRILASVIADQHPPNSHASQAHTWFHVRLTDFGLSRDQFHDLIFLVGETDELLELHRARDRKSSRHITIEEILFEHHRRPWVTGETYVDAKAAGLSDADIVELFYRDILDRPADPEGLSNYLLHRKERTRSLADIRKSLIQSEEYVRRTKSVARAPGAIFSRGMVNLVTSLERNGEEISAADTIEATPERNAGDPKFLESADPLGASPSYREKHSEGTESLTVEVNVPSAADTIEATPERNAGDPKFLESADPLGASPSYREKHSEGTESLTVEVNVPSAADTIEATPERNAGDPKFLESADPLGTSPSYREKHSEGTESLTVEVNVPVDSMLLRSGWHSFEGGGEEPHRWMERQAVILNPRRDLPLISVSLHLAAVYGSHEPMLDCYMDGKPAMIRVERCGTGFVVGISAPKGRRHHTKLRLVSRAGGCPVEEGKGDDGRVLSLNIVRVVYKYLDSPSSEAAEFRPFVDTIWRKLGGLRGILRPARLKDGA